MAIESLRALPTDSHIFIDANIFLYTILGHPRFKSPCEEFLIKLENGEYEGTTSTLILNFQAAFNLEQLYLYKEVPNNDSGS